MQGGGGGGSCGSAKRRVLAGAPELAELLVKLADPELIKPAGDGETAPLFLSNIDQVLAFSVETVYFYRANPDKPSVGVASTLREALKKVLVHYQFLAGRLRLNAAERRLEVECNGAGAQFGEADTELRLADLGDVTIPNPAFRTLVPQAWGAAKITDVPLLMVQVTRFRCGGFAVGFTMGHINYDGIGAIDFLTNFTSFCKGGDMVVFPVHDRTLLRARDPPQIRFDHPEYISPEDIALLAASNPFTTADVANGKLQDIHASQRHIYRVFHFPADALDHLKKKAAGQEQEEEPESGEKDTVKPNHGNGYHIHDPDGHSNGHSNGNANSNGDSSNGNENNGNDSNGNHRNGNDSNDSNGNKSNGNGSFEINGNGFHGKGSVNKVSTFEALASHIWQARSRAVDCPAPTAPATMLFAVDIRGRMSPPLPRALCCNAVFSACARATFQELKEKPLTFCVEKVQSAIGRVTDEYVRSSLDWWEVHRGIPALPGGVFISAWWKLPFYQVDFGWGNPVFAGPIVSSMTEFVLLLPTGRPAGGLNVVISLLPHEMDKFEKFVQI